MTKFYAINIIMIYTKYPSLDCSLDISRRLPIIAEIMSLKRFKKMKIYSKKYQTVAKIFL